MKTVNCMDKPAAPSKIICVGKNYLSHIEEMGDRPSSELVVFMKPNSALDDFLISNRGENIHFEAEISCLIRDGKISAVGFGLDLTKRATQKKLKEAGLPWERAKAFTGSALFSKFVSAPKNISELNLELFIDGNLRQYGGVNQMIHHPMAILDEIQTFISLEDNDIVMMGTPSGVGEVQVGQHFEGRLLQNRRELVTVKWVAQ